MRGPTFRGLTPASSRTSRTMQAVRSAGTRAELALRSAVHRRGLRYRLHGGALPGRPDLVFARARLAVFVDGDFWHGRHWAARRRRLQRGENAAYWTAKIESNRRRDRATNLLLRRAGWRVLRFWETDILRDPAAAASIVAKALKERANG